MNNTTEINGSIKHLRMDELTESDELHVEVTTVVYTMYNLK